MREIYGVCLDRVPQMEERQHLMNAVSEERRAEVNRFVQPEDAIRGLIGEMLVRSVIRDKFHMQNEAITFAKNRYGKPCAVGLPAFHFNVSHSGRWVVCAAADEAVGIDIEEIKPIDCEVAHHFFSTEEYRYLMEREQHMRMSCFYDFWTIKESFVKWLGRGLSVPPQSFSIDVEAYDQHHSLRLAHPDLPCYFKRLNVHPDYKMAVCSATGAFADPVILKRYDELM